MQRLIYSPTIEGLFIRSLGNRLDAPTRAKLREIGIDIDSKLKDGYPPEAFSKGLAVCARALYPTLSEKEANYQMGLELTRGFANTLVGRAVSALSKLVGFRRTLEKIATSIADTSNYTKASTKFLGPTSAELVMTNIDTSPELTQGSIVSAALMAGAKNPRVEIKERDEAKEFVKLLVTWDP